MARNPLTRERDHSHEALDLRACIEAFVFQVRECFQGIRAGPPLRRYRVTPRCRAAVFRRQMLEGVVHSLKQNAIE
jgi:hypothetical protein